MMRIPSAAWSPGLELGLARIPPRVLERMGRWNLVAGVDPAFAGLHRFREAAYGRSYADIAHVAMPYHLLSPAERVPTMIVPRIENMTPQVVVHELGHVLHHALGFEPEAAPVTLYGQTDRYEAFAEAFAAWLCPEYENVREWLLADRRTLALFEALAADAA